MRYKHRTRAVLLSAALATAPTAALAATVTSTWFGGSGPWNSVTELRVFSPQPTP